MKIERVTNITEWINAINPGEVKSAYLPCDKVQSLCFTSQSRQRQAERQVRTLSLLFRLRGCDNNL